MSAQEALQVPFREIVRQRIQGGREALDSLHQAQALTSSFEFTKHFPVKDVMGYTRGELKLFEWRLAHQIRYADNSLDTAITDQAEQIMRKEIDRREQEVQKREGKPKTDEIRQVANKFGELYADYLKNFGSLDPKKSPKYTTLEATKARIAMGNELNVMKEAWQNPTTSVPDGLIDNADLRMHELAGESAPESLEKDEPVNLLFGPLGEDAYTPDARKRIKDAFSIDDRDDPSKEGYDSVVAEARAKAREERAKMWVNYEAEKKRANELVAQGMDVLSAERESVKGISSLYKEQVESGKGFAVHLNEVTDFAAKFILKPDGTSRFPELTDRQARLLARFITPSHDLQKYMAAPNGEDFTADHQMLAANFIREVFAANPNAIVDLGEPEGVVHLTQEDVDFISGVVGDHENIMREEGRREFIHSSDTAERAKAMFFIIDVMTGVIEPTGDSGEFILNEDRLQARFTDLYSRHMNAATRKIFRPEWGAFTIGDIVNTLHTLQSEGLYVPKNMNEILIRGAIVACDNSTGLNQAENSAISNARGQLTTLLHEIAPLNTLEKSSIWTELITERKALSREDAKQATQLLSEVLIEDPEHTGTYTVNINWLRAYFTNAYEKQIAEGNIDWGRDYVEHIFAALDVLKDGGVDIVLDKEGRTLDQVIVAEGMNALNAVKGLDYDTKTEAERKLRQLGMQRLEVIGVLKGFPQVKPLTNLQALEGTTFKESRVRDVTFTREYATVVRDMRIESATSREGLSGLLSGEYDRDPKKVIFVAGTTGREMLFPGMEGSEVYKYTTPIEIEEIRKVVEEQIASSGFEFKKVVSLSMGAKFAGENNNWLDDMTGYIKQQIAEGGVFVIGSTDSNLAGPLLKIIKQYGGKTIGIVPEGPVIFPGYSQKNLDYSYPSAALPTDITIVVQSGKEYDGNESPYFVQVALTEALAQGRSLEIGMINGGKLSLLDEVARLLNEESRKPRADSPELSSNLILVKDAGRGSQLLSILIERQRKRTREGISTPVSVEELTSDMQMLIDITVKENRTNAWQYYSLLNEFGCKSLDEVKAFLKELTKEDGRGVRPFAAALQSAFKAYGEYIKRHQDGDNAVRLVTTRELREQYKNVTLDVAS